MRPADILQKSLPTYCGLPILEDATLPIFPLRRSGTQLRVDTVIDHLAHSIPLLRHLHVNSASIGMQPACLCPSSTDLPLLPNLFLLALSMSHSESTFAVHMDQLKGHAATVGIAGLVMSCGPLLDACFTL